MSTIHVIQRNAHLAGAVRHDTVPGHDGPIARASFIAISNQRRGRRAGQESGQGGEQRPDEPTAIRWTLWGRQADNAAKYLGKGSHVNVSGSLRSDSFAAADGSTAYRLVFTADEVDYLDTRHESQARRERQTFVDEMNAEGQAPDKPAPTRQSEPRQARQPRQA